MSIEHLNFKVPAGEDPPAGPPPVNPPLRANADADDLSQSGENQQQGLGLGKEKGVPGEEEGGERVPHLQKKKSARSIKRCRRILRRMGILEPTLTEISRQPWASARFLEQWESWMEENPQVGAGLVVLNVQRKVAAPATEADRRREQWDKYGVEH